MFWVTLIFTAVSLYMSYRAMNQSQPAQEFQQPQAPTVEQGKPIGVVFGRVRIKDAAVYWWGDTSYEEIRK